MAAAERQLQEACDAQGLKPYAAKVLMKVLYAARYARFDLLRAVCYLAQYITKWDAQCDKRLCRLMCYIHSTYHYRQTGWVGDKLADVSPHLFADADFTWLGPNTVFPLAGQCKKHGCVSHSTPEAEIVATDHAMRTYGLPCFDVWDKLLGRNAVLSFHEDSETAIGAIRNGYSPAMRHIKRTHGVCLRWLAEVFSKTDTDLFYERSALQAADIYTKAFSVPSEWDHATRLINVLDPSRFWSNNPTKVDAKFCMGTVHKGGVEFGYRTSNPWHGRGPRKIPGPPGGDAIVAAPGVTSTAGHSRLVRLGSSTASAAEGDTHVPWISKVKVLPARRAVQQLDRDHALGDWFEEQPDYFDEDYASTECPDSDSESLADASDGELVDEGRAPAHCVPCATCTTPIPTRTSTTTTSAVFSPMLEAAGGVPVSPGSPLADSDTGVASTTPDPMLEAAGGVLDSPGSPSADSDTGSASVAPDIKVEAAGRVVLVSPGSPLADSASGVAGVHCVSNSVAHLVVAAPVQPVYTRRMAEFAVGITP